MFELTTSEMLLPGGYRVKITVYAPSLPASPPDLPRVIESKPLETDFKDALRRGATVDELARLKGITVQAVRTRLSRMADAGYGFSTEAVDAGPGIPGRKALRYFLVREPGEPTSASPS